MSSITWNQSTLFPEVGSVNVEIKLCINQESGTLGIWAETKKQGSKIPGPTLIGWHAPTAEGVAAALAQVWDTIAEGEELHGVRLPVLEHLSDVAPF